ncbi:MAG: hypothetical protein JWL64_2172 [Frankiales bacterium]|nr:hypothetical protein [Frankiales bacterium]
MLALRLISPPELTDALLDVLRAQSGATHLVRLTGAAVAPPGDVLLADLAREAVSDVVAALRQVAGDRCSITLETVDTTISRSADAAEAATPGRGVDAVVWEEVEARSGEESELSVSFLALLVIATLLAAVGVLLDSPVLIVGAMVVGPEFGPVAGLTVALAERRGELALRSLKALWVGFPVAILAALALTLLVRATAGLPDTYDGVRRPLTAFVSKPDGYSLLVALLAGVAGVVSLTSAKSAALVGVAVSVTTVPAAADVGVAAAAGNGAECAGAAAQLGVNLVALVVAGGATLVGRRYLEGRRPPDRAAKARPRRGR